ncbi:hypothetical protein [Amycolatopsis magusensis]|uniref:hypothetical protein n=1 Tax=Amycolatopsis magusensis TaxID=882444 RepID=UPI0024A9F747|nr:hypothetical protein [Amycolatopsis magusensis]MDI5980590.1 hypothetical protein [Amycolatopsis magusensis]
MSAKQITVLPLGLRVSIRQAVFDAVTASPVLGLARSAEDADVLLVDACAPGTDDLPADLPPLPRIVLSVPAADRAPAGSFAAEVAVREAGATGSPHRWCVLRCAAFGEELAWSVQYETAGAFYTAWQPAGAPWVAAADVVELVGRLVTEPDRWQAAYDVTGPATVAMAEVSELLHGLHDRPMPYVRLDEESLVSAMEQVGFAPDYAARRAGYMVWTTSAPGRPEVSSLPAEALGRPAVPLADYLLTAARSTLADAH